MSIDKLEIKNLQSHKDTTLEFVGGINVLTGASDVGKSATVRALKWVTLNRPSGDAFRTHHTKVTSTILDGVTKSRSASKHQYKLNGETYKALRTDVPEAVYAKLNLSEINFQEQHDAYFLIGDSPGQVARTLNEVADLQIIDLSMKSIKHTVRELKTEGKHLNSQLKINDINIEELQWVKEADEEYVKIELVDKGIEALEEELGTLREAIDYAGLKKKVVDRFPEIGLDPDFINLSIGKLGPIDPDIEDNINRALKPLPQDPSEDITTLAGKIASLTGKDLQENLVSSALDASIDSESYLEKFPEIDLSTLNKKIVDLLAYEHQYKTEEESMLEAYVASDCSDEAHSVWYLKQVEFDMKMKELKVCPLCERKI
jgi:hypothetical protein